MLSQSAFDLITALSPEEQQVLSGGQLFRNDPRLSCTGGCTYENGSWSCFLRPRTGICTTDRPIINQIPINRLPVFR